MAPSVLATSNGHSGADRQLGSTYRGLNETSAGVNTLVPGLSVLSAAVGGVFVLGKALLP